MPKRDFNKLLFNFIENTLPQVCSPVNLLHTFRTLFHKNTYGGLLVYAAWLIYIPGNHTCFYHLHCFGYCIANFQQNLKTVSSGKFLKIHGETTAVELSFLLKV